MKGNLTGTNYFLSILWLSWKFEQTWIYMELIIIKDINLGWMSLS